MKKYISIQQGFDLSIVECAKIVKDVGFDGVFISFQEDGASLETIKEVQSLGLDVETIHLEYNLPRRIVVDLWTDNEYAQFDFDKLCEQIDIAYQCGVHICVIHASGTDNPPEPNKIGLEWFRKLAKYAQERDIKLAFENIKSIKHLEYILDNLDEENIYACFDIGHANGFTRNLDTYNWDKIFSRTLCVHLHDNNGIIDEHLIPGMRNINFVKHLSHIKQYNKDLNLTLELYYKGREKTYGSIEPREFYQRAFDAISKIDKELEK